MFSGSFYALLAGFLSAAASLSAKLSLGADYLREMCESRMDRWTETDGGATACDWLHIPLRLLCGGLLFACNAVMWTFFSKALRHCSSSARVTVTTTASNFISSAFLGRVILERPMLLCGGWACLSLCVDCWCFMHPHLRHIHRGRPKGQVM